MSVKITRFNSEKHFNLKFLLFKVILRWINYAPKDRRLKCQQSICYLHDVTFVFAWCSFAVIHFMLEMKIKWFNSFVYIDIHHWIMS